MHRAAPTGRAGDTKAAERTWQSSESKRRWPSIRGNPRFTTAWARRISRNTIGRRPKSVSCGPSSSIPTRLAHHYNLGLLYQQEGNRNAAEAALRHVLRMRPNLAEVHNELANLLRQKGDDEQARVVEFHRALACNPDLAEAHNDLGNLLQESGKLDEAIVAFEHAVRLQPSMAAAHYNLGNALRAAERMPQAAASYRQAVEVEPNFAQAYNNLGTTLDDLGDRDGAMRAFAEAVRSDPLLAEARFNLATALQKCGNLEAARAGYLRAIELDPGHAASHFNLGSVAPIDEEVGRCPRQLSRGPATAARLCPGALQPGRAAHQPRGIRRSQSAIRPHLSSCGPTVLKRIATAACCCWARETTRPVGRNTPGIPSALRITAAGSRNRSGRANRSRAARFWLCVTMAWAIRSNSCADLPWVRSRAPVASCWPRGAPRSSLGGVGIRRIGFA